MNCTRIDHIGIAVPELAAAVKFYEENLGIKAHGYETVDEQCVNVAFMPCGDSELELLESTTPDGPIARYLEKNGGRAGIQHVAIRVDNIDEALAELEAKGIPMIDHAPRYGAGNARIVFVHPKATGGVLLELCQKIAPEEK